MRHSVYSWRAFVTASMLACATPSLAAGPWQLSGSATSELAGTSLVIRAIVSVANETGAPVTGLKRSDFSASYSLRSSISNSLNEGTIQGPINGPPESDGKGTYILLIQTADPQHPPSLVRSIVVRVMQRQVVASGVGSAGVKISFNQRAATVIPVTQ